MDKVTPEESRDAYRFLKDETDFEKVARITLPAGWNYLGQGKQATVIDLGSKVMKMTRDQEEAKSWAELMSKKHPGLWNVSGVYRSRTLKIYVIIGEKLTVNNQKSDALINELELLYFRYGDGESPLTTNSYSNDLTNDLLSNVVDPAISTLIKALNFMNNNGIDWEDIHSNNVLWRGGTPVIIDLGFSIGGRGKPVIVEER